MEYKIYKIQIFILFIILIISLSKINRRYNDEIKTKNINEIIKISKETKIKVEVIKSELVEINKIQILNQDNSSLLKLVPLI